jgi:hypothetical protein
MPKTPVHEDSKPLRREKEVRLSDQILGVQSPAVDAGAHQSHAQQHFRTFVALAPD